MKCYQLEERHNLEAKVYLPHEQNITVNIQSMYSAHHFRSAPIFPEAPTGAIGLAHFFFSEFAFAFCAHLRHIYDSLDGRESWNLISFLLSGGKYSVTPRIRFLIVILKILNPDFHNTPTLDFTNKGSVLSHSVMSDFLPHHGL